MPQTPVYGLPFEAPGDLPGHTLDGGPVGDQPILAEAVEAELSRVDGEIADMAADLSDLSTRTMLLDQQVLSGQIGSGTNVAVPAILRGSFRAYTLRVFGGIDGTLNPSTPLVVRINGDDSTVYRSSAYAVNCSTGAFDVTYANTGNAFPRCGFMSNINGNVAEIVFVPHNIGDTGLVSWTGRGWINAGSADLVRPWQSGGRWNGTTQTLTHFTVRSTNSADTWVSGSRAMLWGHQ